MHPNVVNSGFFANGSQMRMRRECMLMCRECGQRGLRFPALLSQAAVGAGKQVDDQARMPARSATRFVRGSKTSATEMRAFCLARSRAVLLCGLARCAVA